jgi:hypothetical protein
MSVLFSIGAEENKSKKRKGEGKNRFLPSPF